MCDWVIGFYLDFKQIEVVVGCSNKKDHRSYIYLGVGW